MRYSIQPLKRRKPKWLLEDMSALFGLLLHEKTRPVIAECMPLVEVQPAHE